MAPTAGPSSNVPRAHELSAPTRAAYATAVAGEREHAPMPGPLDAGVGMLSAALGIEERFASSLYCAVTSTNAVVLFPSRPLPARLHPRPPDELRPDPFLNP